jgi:molybdopterin-containing oxidoreductase family membrane subunit
MDEALLPEGVKRCSPKTFFLWTLPWAGLFWIVFDLAVIALGAGAFFTGFLTYIIGKKELRDIINAAVIIGFICYSGAIAMLAIDIGQPIRGWFIFWHANVHSMLTEVSFCITAYFGVLCIEYVPLILKNRKLDEIRDLRVFGHHMHHIMAVFAATGTFLSFFHQGSLGGVYGVLYARPFAYRWEFYIWPTTFFLFVFSAIASGPAFTILCTKLTEAVTRKKLVPKNVYQLLAKISGWLLAGYMVLKIADTLVCAQGRTQFHGFLQGRLLRRLAAGGRNYCLWSGARHHSYDAKVQGERAVAHIRLPSELHGHRPESICFHGGHPSRTCDAL